MKPIEKFPDLIECYDVCSLVWSTAMTIIIVINHCAPVAMIRLFHLLANTPVEESGRHPLNSHAEGVCVLNRTILTYESLKSSLPALELIFSYGVCALIGRAVCSDDAMQSI